MTSEIADRIHHVRFTPRRLEPGYEMGPVDALLGRLEAAARRDEPLAPLLVGQDLPLARLRECYDQAEVDAFLGALRDGLPLPAEPEPKPGFLSRLLGRG